MDDVWKRLYVYGFYVDDPIMMDAAGGGRYYYIKDRQQSVKALADAGGSVVERYDYNPFGLMTVEMNDATVDNPYGYTGRRWDSETGLWYYRNRMYSPTLGRFLQRDPAGYVDGMNLYAYVTNNPLGFIDPFGLEMEVLLDNGIYGQPFSDLDNFYYGNTLTDEVMALLAEMMRQDAMNNIASYTGPTDTSFENEFYYGGTMTNTTSSTTVNMNSDYEDRETAAQPPGNTLEASAQIPSKYPQYIKPSVLPGVTLGSGGTASTISALPGSVDQDSSSSLESMYYPTLSGSPYRDTGFGRTLFPVAGLFAGAASYYYSGTSVSYTISGVETDTEIYDQNKGWFSGDGVWNVTSDYFGAAYHFNLENLPEYSDMPDVNVNYGYGRYLGLTYNPYQGTGSINVGYGVPAFKKWPPLGVGVSKTVSDFSWIPD